MLSAVLAVICVVCAIGWASTKIALMATIKYVIEKEYTPPTPEELRACIWKVLQGKSNKS